MAVVREVSFGRSREGAWIEISAQTRRSSEYYVAPARERGLKLQQIHTVFFVSVRRSREGAWIEILSPYLAYKSLAVAPARERGLKLQGVFLLWTRHLSLPRGSVD